MIDDLTIELSKYRLDKAKDLLNQAKLLHENGKFDGSINRSYYAIFNAIRALLALLKLDSSKHSGVISYFDRYFVKQGFFDKRFSKIAHSAFDIRQDNDYEDFYNPTDEESNNQIIDGEDFINEVEKQCNHFIEENKNLPEIDTL